MWPFKKGPLSQIWVVIRSRIPNHKRWHLTGISHWSNGILAKDLLLWQLLKPYAHRFSLAFWNLGLWACCSHRSRKRTKLQVAPPGLVQRYNPNTKLQSSWNNFNPAFQTTLPLINILRHLSVDAQKTPGLKKKSNSSTQQSWAPNLIRVFISRCFVFGNWRMATASAP